MTEEITGSEMQGQGQELSFPSNGITGVRCSNASWCVWGVTIIPLKLSSNDWRHYWRISIQPSNLGSLLALNITVLLTDSKDCKICHVCADYST